MQNISAATAKRASRNRLVSASGTMALPTMKPVDQIRTKARPGSQPPKTWGRDIESRLRGRCGFDSYRCRTERSPVVPACRRRYRHARSEVLAIPATGTLTSVLQATHDMPWDRHLESFRNEWRVRFCQPGAHSHVRWPCPCTARQGAGNDPWAADSPRRRPHPRRAARAGRDAGRRLHPVPGVVRPAAAGGLRPAQRSGPALAQYRQLRRRPGQHCKAARAWPQALPRRATAHAGRRPARRGCRHCRIAKPAGHRRRARARRARGTPAYRRPARRDGQTAGPRSAEPAGAGGDRRHQPPASAARAVFAGPVARTDDLVLDEPLQRLRRQGAGALGLGRLRGTHHRRARSASSATWCWRR